jgi:energy-coupling factor transporter transmembrane protein EcfT
MDPTEAAEPDEPVFYPPSPPWSSNAKLLVVGMMFVLTVVGVYLIRNVLAIAALAALIAFLVAPLIRLGVEHLRIPRGIALILAYLLVFVGTVAFGAVLARSIVESVVELDPIGLVDDVRMWLLTNADSSGHIVIFGLTIDISAFVESLQSSVRPGDGQGAIDAEQVLEYLGAGFSGVKTVLGIVTALITSAIITTLVAMYLNADSGRLHDATVLSLPPGYERDGYMMMAKQKGVWRGYLYGQLVWSNPRSDTRCACRSPVRIDAVARDGELLVRPGRCPHLSPRGSAPGEHHRPEGHGYGSEPASCPRVGRPHGWLPGRRASRVPACGPGHRLDP